MSSDKITAILTDRNGREVWRLTAIESDRCEGCDPTKDAEPCGVCWGCAMLILNYKAFERPHGRLQTIYWRSEHPQSREIVYKMNLAEPQKAASGPMPPSPNTTPQPGPISDSTSGGASASGGVDLSGVKP